MSRIHLGVLLAISGCEDLGNVLPTGTYDPSEHWTVVPHPCVGNRTDAMLVEDGGETVWVGCGTTNPGTGLYVSTNAGSTWGPYEETTPVAGFFSSWRVDDLSRGADGLLYVAGRDTNSSARVVSVTPAGEIVEVLTGSGQLWNQMEVGTFRMTLGGERVAESLTGTDTAYQAANAPGFSNGGEWWTSGSGGQILDLEVFGEDLYGVGSTIGQPPVVYLPPAEGRVGWQMTPVVLAEGVFGYDGELWDVHVDGTGPGGIVVAGVNQDDDYGVVYVSGTNPYIPSDWTRFNADSLFPPATEPTWMNGVCRAGDRIIAVGRFSNTNDGLVIYSDDEGVTWSQLEVPPMTRRLDNCTGDTSGTFWVTGGSGFFGIYAP